MEFHEHIDRCVHWQGVFVSDQGTGYPYVAYAILAASVSHDPAEPTFQSSYVEFNDELLTAETRAYLHEHGDDMTATIVRSFAQLWMAEGRRADVQGSAPEERRRSSRPSRRQRRAKRKLWASIDEFLRQERQVTHD